MMQRCECERWYDGTGWDAEVPDQWTFVRDKTLKNYPYKFTSPDGAVLTVWTGKHVTISGEAWRSSAPVELVSDAERKAYHFAESNAQSMTNVLKHTLGYLAGVRQRLSSELTKRSLGSLVGFTYKISSPSHGWEGFFISEPWMIHARFEAPGPIDERGNDDALGIIASLRFQEVV